MPLKKLLIKFCLALVVWNFIPGRLSAQGVTISSSRLDVGYVGRVYKNILGSPFLFDDWLKGSVVLVNGTKQDGLKLKYDQVADELIFLAAETQAQTFLQPVLEFTLREENKEGKVVLHRFRSGYHPTEGASAATFYEVLAEGQYQLLKRVKKTIEEERSPNSNLLKTKQIKSSVRYYLANGKALTKIKPDQKSLLAALPQHTEEVNSYLKANNLKIKNEADLIRVINYSNTL